MSSENHKKKASQVKKPALPVKPANAGKPASPGKSAKAKKPAPVKKEVRETVMVYYLIPEKVTAKDIAAMLPYEEDKIEVWTEMNLVEAILPSDSLVFEEAAEEFDSKEDIAYLKKENIQTIYAVTYDSRDAKEAESILAQRAGKWGGRICDEDEEL